jgi:hypothetical protein
MKLKTFVLLLIIQMNTSGFQIFNIKRYDIESYDDYMERSFFILNNMRSGKYTFETLLEKSYFYYSIQKLGCKYNTKIMNEIKNLAVYAGLQFAK